MVSNTQPQTSTIWEASGKTTNKTTGRSLADLPVRRGYLTLLDRIKPDLDTKRDIKIWKQKIYHDNKNKSREFRIGEEV
ncbi:hypothetical protein T08_11248 [Trichinella sp. T8]|nr:hypothetical protein T08_11248 [Trichinella sp. T8]